MKEFEQIRKASDEKAAREQASLPRPRGLVLAPTRELVNQIDEVIQPLAEAYGMSTVTVYGGVSYARQVAGLRAGADIVVACPGRLEDLLRQGKLSLDAVEITILDEADEMADMGFLPPVTRLLEQTDSRRSAYAVLGDARPRRGRAGQAGSCRMRKCMRSVLSSRRSTR